MNVVSFGGGTNSTAMIIGMYLHKIPIDLILFADPGAEQPHTYEFIQTFNVWLEKHGLPIITPVFYTDKGGNRMTLEEECLRSHALPSIAYGFKKCSLIWCSSRLHRQLHTPEVKPRPLPLPAKGVKQVRSFMREKKIYCGKHYREVDIYPYTAAQLTASTRGKRSKKIKETEPKQKNPNDKNARRYFTQTANLNFGSDPEALHVTATYSGKYLPDTVEQAEQEATNFLRRVQYRRKKEGLPPLKYMIVTAYTTKRNSETPVRIHHHIIMNGGLDRDVVEDLWRKRRRKGQKKGDKIGFCNADRLQADENGIAALCTYLVKQGCGKKRWNSSHNLERPYSRTNDGKYNRRQIEKWAKEHPPREFWEKKYPGWTLTDDDYGVQYEYNDFTGWAVYLKLRKKE